MGPAIIILLLSLIYVSEGREEVVVKLEEDVTLQCVNPTEERISVLKWSRPDLNTGGYVYFYRNKRSYHNYQHPSFHGRVKLRDPHMAGGDVSLVLSNATFSDAGIYECHMWSRTQQRRGGDRSEVSYFITLTVTASDETVEERQEVAGGGADGDVDCRSSSGGKLVAVGVSAAAAAAAGLMVFWKHQRQKAAEQDMKAGDQQVV